MEGNGCGVRALLQLDVRRQSDKIGFFEVICSFSFDIFYLLVPYRRSFEVDWAWIEAAQHWYPYLLFVGHVLDVPKLRLASTEHDADSMPIYRIDVEPLPIENCQVPIYISIRDKDVMVYEPYGDVVAKVPTAETRRGISCSLKDEDEWDLRKSLF